MSPIIGIIYLLGFSFILYLLYKGHSNLFKVQWDSVSKFIAFMCVVECFRFALFYPQTFVFVDFKPLPMVWLEDACFMLPILILKDIHKVSKAIWIPVAVVSSLIFAYFHLYYGVVWAAITLLYPYVISYRYSIKYSVGTIMVCHVLYDFITTIGHLIKGIH